MRARGAAALVLLAAAACHPAAPVYHLGSITVTHVVSPEPQRGGPGGAYFTIINDGPDDTLIGVTSPDADTTMMHRSTPMGGMVRMEMAAAVPVPAGDTVRFEPGADHVMLTGLHRTLLAGDSLPLTLTFRNAGTLVVSARVVSYADLDAALGPRGR
ncbi:MAG TPA: copper chaperone PCu(A)C [Gemmatimonadales bacterium]|nr:copper chaperone PCu(A)C [Gemmatimonadales bacterium]